MKPSEYFDAAKGRLKIESDYELAKRLNVKRGPLCQMRQGDRAVPLDVAFKLAITLELDPAKVVADLESQREKNPTRRAFWDSFMSRARSVAALILCTLVFQLSAICGSDQNPMAGFFRRRQHA